jgi:hypothetical protein
MGLMMTELNPERVTLPSQECWEIKKITEFNPDRFVWYHA